jgi:2,3-dihydroxybenzoate decarboxylase
MKFYLFPVLFALYLAVASVHRVSARRWRDSGTGAIVLEEAWTIPELLYQMQYVNDRIFDTLC